MKLTRYIMLRRRKLNNLNPPHKGGFYFTLIVLIDIFNI
jgi:hypothetical protein